MIDDKPIEMDRRKLAGYGVVALSFWVLLGIAVLGCVDDAVAERPAVVSLMVLAPQQGDSLGFALGWTSVQQGPHELLIDHYETRLIQEPDTLASGQTTARVDTFWTAMPALGDSLVVKGCMTTVDTAGTQATGWLCSQLLTVRITPQPPSLPDSITLDTIPLDPVVRGVGVQDSGTMVVRLMAVTASGDSAACSQALLSRNDDSTLAIVGNGICTNRVWNPARIIYYIDGDHETADEFARAIIWDLLWTPSDSSGPAPPIQIEVEET